jgi:hypothetical protein
MLKVRWIPIAVLTLIAVVSCVSVYLVMQSQLGMTGDRETVFQVAAFKTFAQGELDGNTTYLSVCVFMFSLCLLVLV